MFQYALGRHLSIKNNASLILDLTELLKRDDINHTPRDFELDVFDIKYAAKILHGDHRSFKERFAFKYLTRKVNEGGNTFDPCVLGLKRTLYLTGYWQNEKYFKDIAKIVRQDFNIKTDVLPADNAIRKKLSSVNSVSVHFRLGDYLSNPNAKNFHGILDPNYYKRAIAKINELVADAHFFIFSDDIDWVKENFMFEQEHTFVSHERQAAADMHLMSVCKHHIIANSSFSWWGAWLNPNPDKIVVAPKKWFTQHQTEIIPDRWMQI